MENRRSRVVFVKKKKKFEFFSDLKRKLKRLYYRFLEYGHQQLTVMFVPHSEKKVISFRISIFSLWIIGIVSAIFIVGGSLALVSKNSTDTRADRLENQTKLQAMQIKKFVESVTVLRERFTSFKENVNKIYGITGVGQIPEKKDSGSVPSFVSDTKSGSSESLIVPPEVEELNRMEREITVNKERIQRVVKFLERNKELMREIPSLWPLSGGMGWITSPFGPRLDPFTGEAEFHTGVDIAALPGTPVRATADGEVVFAGRSRGYGIKVEIKHSYGFKTVYAHLQWSRVRVGDFVKKGQVIGYVGTSGYSTGFHLHYEVRIGNQVVDPIPYLTVKF